MGEYEPRDSRDVTNRPGQEPGKPQGNRQSEQQQRGGQRQQGDADKNDRWSQDNDDATEQRRNPAGSQMEQDESDRDEAIRRDGKRSLDRD